VFRLNEQLFGRPGEGDSIIRTAQVTHATPSWFDILQLQTLAGRVLTDADRGVPVAVVNEALAQRLDPSGVSVVGTPLHLRGFNAGDRPSTMLTIVGVVSDAVP
jgi:hypothetical protein